MFKFYLAALGLCVSCGSLHAQKTVKFDYQTSQARLLDVNPTTYVKPLVAELVVDTSNGRIRDKWELNAAELAARVITGDDNATVRNLRSYAVFKSSEKHDCDVVVAATFDVRITESGAQISIVGYPANFANWSSSKIADYEWIMIE
ncbi:MAG: hypothetical protein K2F88_05705 [Duncaniella sp.]|nr:hypothetical protein [Duncaniella sp.]